MFNVSLCACVLHVQDSGACALHILGNPNSKPSRKPPGKQPWQLVIITTHCPDQYTSAQYYRWSWSSIMDYSWSLLRFLKVTLVVTSVYWFILLSVLVFLLLGQCSSPRSSGDSADVQAGLLTIVFIIVLSVGGGALVILLVAFHLLSQQYFKDSGILNDDRLFILATWNTSLRNYYVYLW